jgi:hypothetical protein
MTANSPRASQGQTISELWARSFMISSASGRGFQPDDGQMLPVGQECRHECDTDAARPADLGLRRGAGGLSVVAPGRRSSARRRRAAGQGMTAAASRFPSRWSRWWPRSGPLPMEGDPGWRPGDRRRGRTLGVVSGAAAGGRRRARSGPCRFPRAE